jgi:hypothetical protein
MSHVGTDTAELSLWDFGGQYVFYTTHQVFLTNRAVYLLVLDLSQALDHRVEKDECFPDMKGPTLWTVLGQCVCGFGGVCVCVGWVRVCA